MIELIDLIPCPLNLHTQQKGINHFLASFIVFLHFLAACFGKFIGVQQ